MTDVFFIQVHDSHYRSFLSSWSITIQAYFTLLCFTLLYFTNTVFVTNGQFVATLPEADLPVSFLYNSIRSLLVSLSNFGNSPNISKFVMISVIGDLWCCCWDCFEEPQAESIDFACVLTALPTSHSTPTTTSGLLNPWDTAISKLGQLNHMMVSKCSSERKHNMSLTLNQKLQIAVFSEEGKWKSR